MKKSVLMLTGIGAALAVVAIAIFGVASYVINPSVYVEEITILNERDDKTHNVVYFDFEGGDTSVQIEWEIKSTHDELKPDNSEVAIRSGNEDIATISDIDQENRTAMINFSDDAFVTITITAVDRDRVESSINFVGDLDYETPVNLNYDPTLNSFSEPSTQSHYFLGEDNTLVFVNNRSYNLDLEDDFELSILSGDDVISIDGFNIETLKLGEAVLTLTNTNEGITNQIDIEVIEYLRGFSLKGGYSTFLNRTDSESKTFESKDGVYQVGSQNAFIAPVIARGITLDIVEEFEKSFVLEKWDGSDYVEANDADTYMNETEDNKAWLEFTQNAEGEQFRLTIEGYYQENRSVTLEFMVNDGFNAHNHEELQTLYEDWENVTRINVHNTIVAQADPDRHLYSDDESVPEELRGKLINEFIHGGKFGVDIEDHIDEEKTGNIYLRPATTDLDIHGNFQTIDGSNLPLIKNDTRLDNYSSPVEEGEHINVQTALFRFGYYEDTYNNGDANLSMSDLYMRGNSKRSDDTFDSGGIHLLYMSSMGDSSLENLRMQEAVIGLFLNDPQGFVYSNNMIINETYNSGVFSWTGNLSITNSKMRDNGGPSIILVDADETTNDETRIDRDPVLIIDEHTLNNIENWVTGEEGWFQGLGVNTIMMDLKSSIEGYANSLDKTIIDHYGDDELVNFKILVMNQNPAEGGGNDYTQAQITILKDGDDLELHRPHNLTDGFPENTYVGPVSEGYLEALIELSMVEAGGGSIEDLDPEIQAILEDMSAKNVEIITSGLMDSPVNIILEWFDSEEED